MYLYLCLFLFPSFCSSWLPVELDSDESSDEYDEREPSRDAKLIDMASKVRRDPFTHCLFPTPQNCPIRTDAVWLTAASSSRCPWWFPRRQNPATTACAAMTSYWTMTPAVTNPYLSSESLLFSCSQQLRKCVHSCIVTVRMKLVRWRWFGNLRSLCHVAMW